MDTIVSRFSAFKLRTMIQKRKRSLPKTRMTFLLSQNTSVSSFLHLSDTSYGQSSGFNNNCMTERTMATDHQVVGGHSEFLRSVTIVLVAYDRDGSTRTELTVKHDAKHSICAHRSSHTLTVKTLHIISSNLGAKRVWPGMDESNVTSTFRGW